MKLKRLFIRNFLSIGEDPVDISFSGKGFTQICGFNADVGGGASNGSGKSAIVEAILFALKGKTLRSLTNEDIVHTDANGPCHVELEFDNVIIKRTLKPSAVKLIIDGKDRTTSSINETKKLIDQLIPSSFDAVANTLIFGQHNMKSFVDSGEPQRRELIESLLDIREYNAFEEKARYHLKELKNEIKSLSDQLSIHKDNVDSNQSFLSSQIEKAKSEESSLLQEADNLEYEASLIQTTEDVKDQWEAYESHKLERENLRTKLTDCKDELSFLIEEVSTFRDQWEEDKKSKLIFENEISSFREKIDNISSEIENIDKEIYSLESEKKDNLNKINSFNNKKKNEIESINVSEDILSSIKQLEYIINEIETSVNNIKNGKLTEGDVCSNCYGVIKAENANNHIEYLIKTKKEKEHSLKSYQEKLKKDKNRVKNDIDSISKKYDTEIKKVESHIQSIENKLSDLSERKESFIKSKSSHNASIKQNEDKIKTFMDDLRSKYEKKLAPFKEKKELLELRRDKFQSQIEELEDVKEPDISLAESIDLENKKSSLLEKAREKKFLANKLQFSSHIDEIRTKLEESKNRYGECKNSIVELEKKLPYYEFWTKASGKSGIKKFIVEQIIPTLNQQLDKWLQILYGGNIELKFDSLLNPKITDRLTGRKMSFGQGSGGERRRMDLAVMLAFRDVMQVTSGQNPNILFLDEVAENLDDDGVMCLFSVIQELSETNEVFIISHHPELKTLLSESGRTMFLEKKNGVTKVTS